MSHMTIKAEFIGGTGIKQAFEDAIRVAELLDVCIEFDFNGVTCFAVGGHDAGKAASAYMDALRSGDKHKMAFSR